MCAAPRGWNEHDEWIITLTPGLRGTGRVATTDVRSLKNGVEPSAARRRDCSVRRRCSLTQLFHEEANNEDFAVIVRSVDWGRVNWELQEFSGVALRHVRVDRAFQLALDEARDQATQFGIVDERQEVVTHWTDAKSWMVAPVIVDAALLGGGSGYELLVGYTRLGNLLGMLDREEVSEVQKHLVWLGRGIR
jgi:hypothetical protein